MTEPNPMAARRLSVVDDVSSAACPGLEALRYGAKDGRAVAVAPDQGCGRCGEQASTGPGGVWMPCPVQRLASGARAYTVAGFPASFAGATLAAFKPRGRDQERAAQGCRAWLRRVLDGDSTARTLMLVGPNGSGKSHLATATAAEYALRRGGVAFGRFAALLAQLRESFGGTGDDPLGRLTKVKLAVLDDIGSESHASGAARDFEYRTLSTLVSARWDSGRPTIVTSNMELGLEADYKGEQGDRMTIVARFGGTVASRLAHGCTLIRVLGRDQRTDTLEIWR